MKFAVYDANGAIQRILYVQDDASLLANIGEHEDAIPVGEGVMDDTHYVRDGALVEIPPAPNALATWDVVARAWVDQRDLQAAKDARWEHIKAQRSIAESSFMWDGSKFNSDTVSQVKIIGAAQLATIVGDAFAEDWTLHDNSVRRLNAAQMVQVGIAMGQSIGAIYAQARALRDAIEAAATLAAVDVIDWPS